LVAAGAEVDGAAVVLGAPVVDGTAVVLVGASVLVVFFGIEPTALPGWAGPPATAPSRSAPIIWSAGGLQAASTAHASADATIVVIDRLGARRCAFLVIDTPPSLMPARHPAWWTRAPAGRCARPISLWG
jgi:hypothetical protein